MSRWLFSTSAKDISVLYLIISLFSGMMGTGFSAIMRLELSSPGYVFLHGDNQVYNMVITAHALAMSAPQVLIVYLYMLIFLLSLVYVGLW